MMDQTREQPFILAQKILKQPSKPSRRWGPDAAHRAPADHGCWLFAGDVDAAKFWFSLSQIIARCTRS